MRFLRHVLIAIASLLPTQIALAPNALAQDAATATVQVAAPAATGPVTVQVGAYILRINDVVQKDGTFTVDMWTWFRWKDGDVKPYETFEISNGRIENRSEVSVQRDGDMNYANLRIEATVFHDYDVKKYPMDNHFLTISIEDQAAAIDQIVYVADTNTALDPRVNVPGWAVKLAAPSASDHVYPTNYGLLSSAAASTYSQLNFNVELRREGLAPLFKQFWIAGLSVLLGLLAFKVKATDLDARFGLGVGSIFAASANAFVISDSLPQSTVITMAEQINFLAIGTIFLCVAMSIFSLRLCYLGKDDQSEQLDTRAMAVIGIGYVAVNVAIVALNL